MVPEVPRLGVGTVYWESIHDLFEAHPDIVQVAEVEPSTFWLKAPGAGGAVRSNRRALDRIAALAQVKLVHGVGYPIGGTLCDNDLHIGEMRRWTNRLAAAWTSEHLSFNETPAGTAGFLLPPCQSDDGVAVAAANIRARAAALGLPFAFETGVSYLPRRAGEMADGDFFAAVAEAADCLILLDLHNLWTNERNGRARVRDVVAALPLDRVCEIHLAGGLEKDGFWLDAHSGFVPPALFDLAADLAPDLPAVGAILFEIAEEHAAKVQMPALLRQIETLHRLWERLGHGAAACRRARRDVRAPAPGLAGAWEEALLGALSGAPRGDMDAAIALYRDMIVSVRKGALARTLTHSLRLLQLTHGEAAIDAMLADYANATQPQTYPGDEAIQFSAWLRASQAATPFLDDMLTLEEGIVAAGCTGVGRELRFGHDPTLIVEAIARGRPPADLPAGDYRIALGFEPPPAA